MNADLLCSNYTVAIWLVFLFVNGHSILWDNKESWNIFLLQPVSSEFLLSFGTVRLWYLLHFLTLNFLVYLNLLFLLTIFSRLLTFWPKKFDFNSQSEMSFTSGWQTKLMNSKFSSPAIATLMLSTPKSHWLTKISIHFLLVGLWEALFHNTRWVHIFPMCFSFWDQ